MRQMPSDMYVPVCEKCGMTGVTLAVTPVTDDEVPDLTFYCGFGCLKLAAEQEISREPHHPNASLPRPATRRRYHKH